MPGSWCAHTCVTDGTLESGSCPSPGEFSDVGCSHGSLAQAQRRPKSRSSPQCARHRRTRSPRQASRAASEAAPSPSPSPRGRRGAPSTSRRTSRCPTRTPTSEHRPAAARSDGCAFGSATRCSRQLKVLKQRARRHLAALHAEKQMLEEQAAAATRRLREHEGGARRAPREAEGERRSALCRDGGELQGGRGDPDARGGGARGEHAALLDERAPGRRAAEEGRRRSEERGGGIARREGAARRQVRDLRGARRRAAREGGSGRRGGAHAADEAAGGGGSGEGGRRARAEEREELEASRDRPRAIRGDGRGARPRAPGAAWRARPSAGGGDVLLDSGEPADDGAVDWAARRRDRLPAGSPGVYPSNSSPALFTR